MANVYPFTGTTSGKMYYQFGETIGIYPTPSEVKTIRMHYVRDPLTVTTSQPPEIRSEYHDLLAQYAVMQITKRLNPELYVMYRQEFELDKDKLLSGNKNVHEEIMRAPHKHI